MPMEFIPKSQGVNPYGYLQRIYEFENGYGASVLEFSEGLTMAVTAVDVEEPRREGQFIVQTSITAFEVKCLGEGGLQALLVAIAQFPKR